MLKNAGLLKDIVSDVIAENSDEIANIIVKIIDHSLLTLDQTIDSYEREVANDIKKEEERLKEEAKIKEEAKEKKESFTDKLDNLWNTLSNINTKPSAESKSKEPYIAKYVITNKKGEIIEENEVKLGSDMIDIIMKANLLR
jgi:hypothetical protein